MNWEESGLGSSASEHLRHKLGAILGAIFDGSAYEDKAFLDIPAESHKILFEEQIASKRELDEFQRVVAKIRQFKHLVIIGMGGAILNPKAILDFAQYSVSNSIDVHYNCHLDIWILDRLRDQLDLDKTAFLVISKSGDTIETLAILHYWQETLKIRNISTKGKVTFIVGNMDSPIGHITSKIELAEIIRHSPSVGGRFSGFTATGILPGMVVGADVLGFLAGGKNVLSELKDLRTLSSGAISAIRLAALYHTGYSAYVYISYLKGLESCLNWIVQIISESLGKEGMEISISAGIGPQEHHSQMQAFLSCKNKRVYSFINPFWNRGFEEEGMNKVLHKAQSLVYRRLREKQNAIRTIVVEELTLLFLGRFMMHTIVETILLGLLLDINPYNQPVVNAIKQELLNTKCCQ